MIHREENKKAETKIEQKVAEKDKEYLHKLLRFHVQWQQTYLLWYVLKGILYNIWHAHQFV